jgi:hypothetical protein
VGQGPLKAEQPVPPRDFAAGEARLHPPHQICPSSRAGPPPVAAPAGVSLVFRHTRAYGGSWQWFAAAGISRLDGQAVFGGLRGKGSPCRLSRFRLTSPSFAERCSLSAVRRRSRPRQKNCQFLSSSLVCAANQRQHCPDIYHFTALRSRLRQEHRQELHGS